MFGFNFSPGPKTVAEAGKLTVMARQLEGLMSPVVTGAFGMVRAADGRPIIYSVNNSGGGDGGAIVICGTPLTMPIVVETDTACPGCDLDASDVVSYGAVRNLKFRECDFSVVATSECNGNPTESGSGSGGSNEITAVEVRINGKTATVPRVWDVIFCDTCTILIQWAYDCFYHGIYQGTWVGPPVSCGSGS